MFLILVNCQCYGTRDYLWPQTSFEFKSLRFDCTKFYFLKLSFDFQLDVGRTSNQESLLRSIQFSRPISDQLLTGDALEPASELSLTSTVEERIEGTLNSSNASANSWLPFRPMDTPPKSELFGVMGTYMKKQNSLAEEAANMARANAVGKNTYLKRLEHRERASSLKYITSKYLEHLASK